MKTSLNIQIIIAAVIGIALGIPLNIFKESFPYSHHILYLADILSSIFVNLLKMILIPLIFTSITIGIANLQAHAQMNKVWRYTMLYFLLTPILAACIGLTAMNIFKPGVGLNIDTFEKTQMTTGVAQMSIAEFLKQFISNLFMNPIAAMAKGEVLSVVVFALLLGIALIKLGNRTKGVLNLFNELFEIIMQLVQWIMRIAPIGIMALLLKLVASQDINLFKQLGLYISVVVGSTLLHGIIILPSILYFFTGMNPLKFFKAMEEALITAFSTSSSSATMPVTMRCVEENLKVDKGVAGFVIPLGTTVNMDGTAMYEAAAALFVANIVGIELNMIQQAMVVFTAVLASIGAPGIPSAGMVTMIMVFQSVGLPIEAIAILLPFDRPLDALRTVVNVEGDAICSLIVQKQITK